jgi:hypothetical protein
MRARRGTFVVTCYSHLLSEEATMVRFIQATISGGKKVYFNADRISAILESSRSDSKSIASPWQNGFVERLQVANS